MHHFYLVCQSSSWLISALPTSNVYPTTDNNILDPTILISEPYLALCCQSNN